VKVLLIWIGVAALLWGMMFSPWTAHLLNFWVGMSVSAAVLIAAALKNIRIARTPLWGWKSEYLFVGIVSAAILYGVFWAGKIATAAVFPQSPAQVSAVYSTASQAPAWLIAGLLLFLIGPAEEIFWRGFVQERCVSYLRPAAGFCVAVAVYTLVHVWSFNPMLLVAVMVCGICWGWMYMRYRSLWPGIISHGFWDVLVFVFFPLG
jgi:uncharacterized protein